MTGIRIGRLSVAAIEESFAPGMDALQMFADCTPEDLARHRSWLVPDYLHRETNRLLISLHAWLIRTGHHTILVDTCGGNHKNRPAFPRFHMQDTPFLDRLRAAGVDPAEVDYVMCTHLHVDHVGWNTQLRDGRWIPTFPNARYLVSRQEHDLRAEQSKAPDGGGVNAGVYQDSVLPIVEAGQARFADGTYQIDDELIMEPAPGHTPGHAVLMANSDGERAVFCGDIVHSPLQIHHPAWNSAFCEVPDEARKTRRRILQHCCEHHGRLFPAHFGASHHGFVEADGDAFRYAPVEVKS